MRFRADQGFGNNFQPHKDKEGDDPPEDSCSG